MSATPPFGPAYGQSPDDGQRPSPNQWQPQTGRPRAAQGGPNPGRPGDPNNPGNTGGRPQAGRPAAGQGPQMPAAGGRPQAGRGPVRPQGSPYQSPQGAGHAAVPPQQPPRGPQSYQPEPQQPAPADETRSPEPFEEAAFEEEPAPWGAGEGTTAINKLGYVPKETRRRSDFQKVRSRARKSSPWPKIIAAIVAVGLLAGVGWWWFNREDPPEQTDAAAAGLTYGGSEEPCSLVDAAPLESYVDGVEPETVASAEQKSRGWEQSCVLTYGAADSAVALLEFEGVSFESDAKASVNYELGAREVSEMADPWTAVEPAPGIGDEAAAVARVVDEGTSNYQLHVQDDNVYLILRLSVVDSGLDQQGLTDLSAELTSSYLSAWQEAS